ncbi:MAG: hypothetical protein M1837_000089 [Sclerophora amabilis]|nr:MAG: hypothetical protein M1837_000089 [Sclerophora amabilis]
MQTSPWLLLMLCTLSAARPATTTALETRDQGSTIKSYFEAIAKHIATIRHMPKRKEPPVCDLDKLSMPTEPALPPPAYGCKVSHVGVGRGIQNYTCADSSANTKPVAFGAIAKLYNATCTGSIYPDLLKMMAPLALQIPTPASDAQLSPPNLLLSGHHFFSDLTTPVFNMDTAQERAYGLFSGKKDSSVPAPANAPKGTPPRGSKPGTPAYGSVPWLKLVDNSRSRGFKEVYRINTAGGNPPPTCEGMPKVFSVDYAAE